MHTTRQRQSPTASTTQRAPFGGDGSRQTLRVVSAARDESAAEPTSHRRVTQAMKTTQKNAHNTPETESNCLHDTARTIRRRRQPANTARSQRCTRRISSRAYITQTSHTSDENNTKECTQHARDRVQLPPRHSAHHSEATAAGKHCA